MWQIIILTRFRVADEYVEQCSNFWKYMEKKKNGGRTQKLENSRKTAKT